MIPEIIEYEDGRIKVTAAAYTIPETKALIDKYEGNVEPYLGYVRALSHPMSPYIHMATEDKIESARYDMEVTLGEFDYTEPLLEPAIKRLQGFYETEVTLMADEMGQELHRLRTYLRTTPISEKNMRDRMAYTEKIDRIT